MPRFSNPVTTYSEAPGGKLYFYENGSRTNKKDTWYDDARTIKNTNPIVLDAEGSIPDIFGEGSYSVKLERSDGTQVWVRDNVQFSPRVGQFSDWSTLVTYNTNEIVRASDGRYYTSTTSSNVGNNPISSPANWTQLVFPVQWNASQTYAADDVVLHEGVYYASLQADNAGNNPLTSRTYWQAQTLTQYAPWVAGYTYEPGDIVERSGGYYTALIENTGQDPDADVDSNDSHWSRLEFIVRWNQQQTYMQDDIVVSAGRLYRSLADENFANSPGISPAEWQDFVSSSVAAYKGANQDRMSTTTTALDSDLFVEVDVGEVYQFVLSVSYSAGSASPGGLRWSLGGTSSPVAKATFQYSGGAAADPFGFGAITPTSTEKIVASADSPTFAQVLTVIGTVEPSASGTFGFAWAQENASADYTRVQQRSSLTVTKL